MSKEEAALKALTKTYGDEKAEQFLASLSPLGHKLSRFSLEWVFGDIYSNSSLDKQTRELINIAALVVSGDCLPQVKNHVKIALDMGCSKEKITDTILQMLIIKGFPAVVNAILAINEVFDENQ